MSRDPAEILKDALALPADARAALANSLFASLDTQVDEDAEQEWQQEISRRAAEFDSGDQSALGWSEARARLLARIQE